MVITIFRSRLRPEHEAEYAKDAEQTYLLAAAMPGFVGVNSYAADDGERVTIVEFVDDESHAAWRNHPEHKRVQRLGREKYYTEFRIQICRLEREYKHP